MERLEKRLCAAVVASLGGKEFLPPAGGMILWNAFQQLSRQRSYSTQGPNPIRFADIRAWCQLMRLPLAPHHVDILMAMDEAWLDRAYAGSRVPEGVKKLGPISQQPISAALLDAVLG